MKEKEEKRGEKATFVKTFSYLEISIHFNIRLHSWAKKIKNKFGALLSRDGTID